MFSGVDCCPGNPPASQGCFTVSHTIHTIHREFTESSRRVHREFTGSSQKVHREFAKSSQQFTVVHTGQSLPLFFVDFFSAEVWRERRVPKAKPVKTPKKSRLRRKLIRLAPPTARSQPPLRGGHRHSRRYGAAGVANSLFSTKVHQEFTGSSPEVHREFTESSL